MLIKLSYKAMLIKKMKERQDRLMLQLGEHRLPVKGSCVLLTEVSRNQHMQPLTMKRTSCHFKWSKRLRRMSAARTEPQLPWRWSLR